MDLRDFLRKDDRRQLEIIEVLAYEKNGVHRLTLGEQIGLSQGILENYIYSINKRHHNFNISLKKSHYYLTAEKDFALDSIYTYYLTNTAEGQLLRLLFEETAPSIIEAAESLFLSKSSFNRIYKKIADILIQYNVTIKNHPLRLTGNEVFIRYLYTLFFNQQRMNNRFLFADEHISQLLFKLTAIFFKDNLTRSNYYIHDQLYYSACVGIWRERHGHHLQNKKQTFFNLSPTTEELVQELQQCPFFYKQTFDIDQALWLVKGNYLFVSLEQFDAAIENDHRIKHVNETWKQLLVVLTKEAQLELSSEEERSLLARLSNENYIYSPKSDYISVFRRPIQEFLWLFEEQYPKDLASLNRWIDQFEKQIRHHPTNDQLDCLRYALVTSLPDLFTKIHPQLQVLVLSDMSIYHNDYLVKDLVKHFPKWVRFNALNEIYADFSQIHNQLAEYDLIISTFTLPKIYQDLNVLTIKPMLNFSDLETLQKELQKIAAKKAANS